MLSDFKQSDTVDMFIDKCDEIDDLSDKLCKGDSLIEANNKFIPFKLQNGCYKQI